MVGFIFISDCKEKHEETLNWRFIYSCMFMEKHFMSMEIVFISLGPALLSWRNI